MSSSGEVFEPARQSFEDLLVWLDGEEAASLSHGELEDQLDGRGRELLRQMLQGQLDLRALRERRAEEVVCAEGVAHRSVEPCHRRRLATIFGRVSVERLA